MSGLKFPDIGTVDSLGVLSALLPGLLTVVIVRALSARSHKLDVVEVILHALAYTLLINAIWQGFTLAGSWSPTSNVIGLSVCALVLGVALGWGINRGVIYARLRKWGLTSEASWSTIWETAFREFRNNEGEYSVLHLRDGRRVYGAIRGFSAQQKDGHVCLDRVRWLGKEASDHEQPGMMLFSAEDIGTVEFVPPTKDQTDGRRKDDSTSSDASGAAPRDSENG